MTFTQEQMFIIGGYNDIGPLSSIEAYDGNSWNKM